MARVSANEATEKWQRRMTNAIPDIVRGVGRVTEAPGKAAAAKADKMKQNIIKSLDDGTWARRVSGVPLEEWKSKTVSKVQERLSGGVQAAASKHTAFMEKLLPHVDAGVSKVRQMPDVTLDDSINRMTTMIRHMAEFRR